MNEKLGSTERLLESNPYKKMLEETQEQMKGLEKEKINWIKEVGGLKERVSELEMENARLGVPNDKETVDVRQRVGY